MSRIARAAILQGLLLAAAMVAVVLSQCRRAEEHTGINDDLFTSTVDKIRAVQLRRESAQRCISDLKEKVPALMNGNPTLIYIGIDMRMPRANPAALIYDRWKNRGLNGVWVPGVEQFVSPMTTATSAICLSFIPPGVNTEWIVLDRTGGLFWAGDQENLLKQSLWFPDPNYKPSPNGTIGGNGLNLLLNSGHILRDEETVMMVTWSVACKWYFGQCLFVNSQIAAMKRLDETPPEVLAKQGLAKLEATRWLDQR